MEKVKQKIQEYNIAVVDLFGEDDDDYLIHQSKTATDADIIALESLIGFAIPSEPTE
ncbi:MAG: hypothetical protein ABIV51_01420 [Saprospiraceae bacterium]